MAKTKGGHRRPKGEGSIQVMPNGNYKMTISIGVGLDGKQKRKSITASSKPILMSKVAKLRVSLGQDIQHSSTPKLFKDVAKQWLESKEGMVSTNSYISYTTTYKSFFYLFDSYRIDKITSDIIDEALMSVKGTKSNRRPSVGTLIGYKRVLGVFFNYAVDKQYIATSPMKRTMTFSKRKQKVDLVIPTKEELKGILQDAKKFDKETKDYTLQIYPLFLLATATGMRLGEMLNLRHSDIDMNTNTIFIKHKLL
ncbi:tyrosine-type recombinase/integrase [Pectinatus frisingensis]|uniref:tyrosine-type recombinase/integrase n=1 Tax=Pectinatus frisingensis TaxID=865 RepID=UPI0018C473A9|nr:site-specific integrase [Pectinatus frisingensis]